MQNVWCRVGLSYPHAVCGSSGPDSRQVRGFGGAPASLSISASIEISLANQLQEPDAQSPQPSQEEGVAPSPAGYLTWLPPPFILHWAAAAVMVPRETLNQVRPTCCKQRVAS